MNDEPDGYRTNKLAATLVVRRRINAPREKLFAAWTQPELLVQWWGPQGVVCPAAEIDLRVGGSYRIANQFPDGTVLWIAGTFEVIERPHRLICTWKLESLNALMERVTVCFEVDGAATEVIVTHERIPDEAARTSHERGWTGCLDRFVRYAEQSGIE
ncbi:MAG: SRPBCC domain-containing protein [Steroidobacteraceae bacterium]|jgi:uncharacterized protein YndB with AHSA1/START domain